MQEKSEQSQKKEQPKLQQVKPGVLVLEFADTNVCLIENRGTRPWILVDTGPSKTAQEVLETVRGRYGQMGGPAYIVLTSGRLQRAGAAATLAQVWEVPVYASKTELPYLTGRTAYPDGGPAAHVPTARLLSLPQDGALPAMEEWEWIAAPGDTPGQISLFRERDGVLIAGGAVSRHSDTGKTHADARRTSGAAHEKSAAARISGASSRTLRSLRPRVAVPGQGVPLYGEALDSILAGDAQRADAGGFPPAF